MHRLVVFTILTASLGYSASPLAVAPRVYRAPQQEKLQRALRQRLPSRNQKLIPPRLYVLPALNNEQLRNNATRRGHLQVGVHRSLQADAFRMARQDGSVWRLAIQSPDATAVRLHFTGFDVGAGQVWLHDGSGGEEATFGPYSGRGPNGDGDFWSDTVFSDSVTVEYQPEDGRAAGDGPPFAIEELSHQFSPFASPGSGQQAAASCELDVNCYPAWADTAKGVARITFEMNNETYSCSGSLLNTRNNANIPYFLTAHHCLDTDAVARTVEAMWFYQKDNCNGVLPNRSFPRSLGSTVVVTGDASKGDFTLLKLNSMPDGVTLEGWDPEELPVGTPFTVIHHPSGDYKRISFGNVGRNADTAASLYWVTYSSGITEHGSSGSGMYSAPGVLVGTLSTGLNADTPEGNCRYSPYSGSFGKFSTYYPLLKDVLEGRSASAPATPPQSNGTTLTSGVPSAFEMPAVSGSRLFPGFSVNVPPGATRLDIVVRTTTPNADVDLFVRYGQDVALVSGNVVADFTSQGPTGNEQVTISASSSPSLRPGTYYIGLGLFTLNTLVGGTVTATVTTGGAPPPTGGTTPPLTGGSTALNSGAARNFTIPPVNGPTLLNRNSGFTIDVPQGATRLDVKLSSKTPGVDLDLYVRYGQDPVLVNDTVTAEYGSHGATADESVVVTGSSDPPLKAGTYYIAFGVFTRGVAIDATVTATVSTGAPPPATGSRVLTSGQPGTFNLVPVTDPTLYNGTNGYTIVVPQGATSLDIVLHTATRNADVDLFARYNQDIDVDEDGILADWGSEGDTGEERITINSSSNPPLRAGTYYIGLVLYTLNTNVTGTITATVSTSSTPPPAPAGGPAVLTSGVRQTLLFNPVSDPTFLNGALSFVIDVPANSTKLDVQLATSTAGADLDLFVSYGKDNGIGSDGISADFGSDGPDGNEHIVITPDSNPSLRPGRYYISIVIYTTGTSIQASLTATVSGAGGGQPPAPPSGSTVLTSGRPATFSLPAVSSPTLFTGDRSFQIQVPPGSVSMRIQLVSDRPAVDLDLFIRSKSNVAVDSSGSLLADYSSEGPTGNETITITTRSSPPLQPGVYYIALGLATTGQPATGTIQVTVSSDILSIPNAAGAVLMSGASSTYSLPAVKTPTLFAGSSAYRISVDRRHTALRIGVRDNAPGTNVAVYVRRGQQPAVVDGRVIADYSANGAGGGDIVLDGASLKPGVYYVALGLNSTDVTAAGTISAQLTPADPVATEFQMSAVSGISIAPKPAAEIRYELAEPQAVGEPSGTLRKQMPKLKKHRPFAMEVGR